jgi:hypothetical protein
MKSRLPSFSDKTSLWFKVPDRPANRYHRLAQILHQLIIRPFNLGFITLAVFLIFIAKMTFYDKKIDEFCQF